MPRAASSQKASGSSVLARKTSSYAPTVTSSPASPAPTLWLSAVCRLPGQVGRVVSPVRQTHRSLESLVRLIVTLPLRAVVPLTQVPARPRPVLAVVVVSVAAVVVTLVGWRGTAVLPRAVAAAACGPTWVTAWQAAMQPGPAPRAVAGGGTLRMVVRPQVEGAQIRVRLSNVYGSTPLVVDAVSAARMGGGRPDAAARSAASESAGLGAAGAGARAAAGSGSVGAGAAGGGGAVGPAVAVV